MNKEFIPYKQAVALKELGFDEPCFATYNHDKELSRNPSHDIGDLPIEGQPYYWQNTKIHISCVASPLYQQAFRWFREKYDLDNAVLKDRYVIETQEDLPTWYYGFETYEEAELACLNKLIELTTNRLRN